MVALQVAPVDAAASAAAMQTVSGSAGAT